MPYHRRTVDDELDAICGALSAIALEGAKGVGKTATALQRAATVQRLDDANSRAVAAADPGRLLQAEPPVLLDEWQRLPEVWDAVRRRVDAGAAPGSFLLTGSATPREPPTHSGAGRIVSVQMRPLALWERGVAEPSVSLKQLLRGKARIAGSTAMRLADYAEEVVRSGFPGLRALSGRALRLQLDGYLRRLAEHDFPALGHRLRNPAALSRWMRAYAAATATTTSLEKIRDAATGGEGDKPAKTTTQPYRDVLERCFLLEPLPAWLPTHNRLARLAAPPKHHLVDPALAARLLGVDAAALLEGAPSAPRLRDGPLLGALFESLVTLDVRVAAQASECSVKHLRQAGGAREVDLVVERGDGRIVALEVKLARHVDEADVRHLIWLRERLGEAVLDVAVITCGEHAYRRTDGVAVIPAALLGP